MVLRKKKKSGFHYVQRPNDSIKKREQQSGSSREGFIKQDVKVWTPMGGLNKVRFLPPTWDDAGHFGLDVWVHYQVGPDGNAYLCLKRNGELREPEDCPCCDARQQWAADGHEDAANGLNAKKRVLAYIIDRNREHDGVVLWPMPYTVDRDLAGQCQDEETGAMYFIDHPESGYDVSFVRDGQGQTTKYRTPKLARREKAISDDQDQQEQWLEWIDAHPIPEMLVWADAESMEEALQGGPGGQRERTQDKLKRGRKGAEDEDEEEEDDHKSRVRSGTRARSRPVEDEDEDEDEAPPKRRRRAGVDDEEEEEKALRGKSRKVSKRDEDEDEEDEDDDDEEETPRVRHVAKTTSRTRKARDESEDNDDEDAEEAERPRSGRIAAKGKSSSVDPDDDEDDDDEPPKRTVGKDPVKTKLGGKLGRLRR